MCGVLYPGCTCTVQSVNPHSRSTAWDRSVAGVQTAEALQAGKSNSPDDAVEPDAGAKSGGGLSEPPSWPGCPATTADWPWQVGGNGLVLSLDLGSEHVASSIILLRCHIA